MTNQSETINEKDLIVRKDGLFYKKHAKKPFTGSGEVFLEYGTWQVNCKDGKIEGLVEGFHETNKENVYEALKLLDALYVYWDTLNRGEHPLKNCSEKFTSNKEFMLEAIKRDVDNLEYASDALKQDKELLLAAITHDPFYFEKIPEELKTDKKLFYDTAKKYFLGMFYSLEDFPQYGENFCVYWREDYDWKEDFAMFSNDKDVALEIFSLIWPSYYFKFFEFLGPMLNADKKFMHSIYRQMGTYISTEHKGSMDCLDFEHRTLELSDEAIEGHLSGITEVIRELKPERELEEKLTRYKKEQKEKGQERRKRIDTQAEEFKNNQDELF